MWDLRQFLALADALLTDLGVRERRLNDLLAFYSTQISSFDKITFLSLKLKHDLLSHLSPCQQMQWKI